MNFIDHRTNIIQAIIADPTLTLFTTLHGILRIINRFTLAKVSCQLTLIEDAYYRIYQASIPSNCVGCYFSKKDHPYIKFSHDHPDIAFTTDIRSGVFDAGTVLFWALQILLFLGFTRLYIAGLDMTNFHAEKFESIIIPAFTYSSQRRTAAQWSRSEKPFLKQRIK